MIEIGLKEIIFMFFMCILAGFIDSIAGGGGLISLTSYYLIGLPPAVALGCNKFSSTIGTVFASINYIRKKTVIWRVVIFTGIFSLIGSAIGAHLALLYAGRVFRYIMLFVLPFVTVLTFLKLDDDKKNNTLIKRDYSSGTLVLSYSLPSYFVFVTLGTVIGLYDGFFGPGTGMFYTISLTLLGLPIMNAAGSTRIINLVSNIAAVITFISGKVVVYKLGIPCMFASIIGNLLGSEFALKKGKKGIKPILLAVLFLLYIKIILDLFI